MEKGKIITIEGNDCSGKETQSKILLERLFDNDVWCEQMSFPRYETPTGRIIGGPYLGKEGMGESFFEGKNVDPLVAAAYFIADRVAAIPEINSILNSGTHLILDRYTQSNMAHQGGRGKTKREKIDIARQIEDLEMRFGIPSADKVIVLHMPYEFGIELNKNRPGGTDLHERDTDHLINAEKTYKYLTKYFSKISNWEKIDCVEEGDIKSREEISEEVWSSVKNFLKI